MSETDLLGTVLREGDRLGLRFERTLRHAPEKVWRAITESEHLAQWFPCDLVGERRPRASIELVFWPAHVEKYGITEPVLPGQLRVYDPPAVLEFTWGGDVVRFDLAPDGEGTLLVLTTWLEDGEHEAAYRTAAGYHLCLANLRELLDDGKVSTPLVDVDVSGAEAVYARAMDGSGEQGSP